MTRLPFILLLSVFLFNVDSLKIHIEGKIECYKKDFTYQFTIQEFDWMSNNDLLFEAAYHQSTAPHYYVAETRTNDRDEGENDFYEIFVSFYHDCTTSTDKYHHWMHYESRVGYIRISDLAVILTHNVNLTNASGYLKKSDWSDWRQ
ncbi:unnamed protein product [Caenorhabditis brenneri]